MMKTSNKNNISLENLNDKFLEKLNDKDNLAFYLLSPLSKIANPEYTSQFKLVKYPSSNRVSALLLNKTKQVTL